MFLKRYTTVSIGNNWTGLCELDLSRWVWWRYERSMLMCVICAVSRSRYFSQCSDWFLIWSDWLIFWSDPSVPAGWCSVGCFTFVWLILIIEIINRKSVLESRESRSESGANHSILLKHQVSIYKGFYISKLLNLKSSFIKLCIFGIINLITYVSLEGKVSK